MAEPIKTTPAQTTFTGSVGLKAGYNKYFKDGEMLVFGARAEGKVERNGYYAQGGVTAGTVLGADVALGKEIKVNNKLGLDLSANAEITRSNLEPSYATIEHTYYDGDNGIINNSTKKKWQNTIFTGGAKAMAKYTPNNRITIGAGVSGQYVTDNAPKKMSLTTTFPDKPEPVTSELKLRQKDFKISPEVSFSAKTSNKVSIGLDANRFGGTASIKYTF